MPENLNYQVRALKLDEVSPILIETKAYPAYIVGKDGVFRNTLDPSKTLPPRTFFREATTTFPAPFINSLLLIFDAATKVINLKVQDWPGSHEDLLLSVSIFLQVVRRMPPNEPLYDTALRTAAYLLAKDKPVRPSQKLKRSLEEAAEGEEGGENEGMEEVSKRR